LFPRYAEPPLATGRYLIMPGDLTMPAHPREKVGRATINSLFLHGC
jgi:hypothetical protein